MEIKTELNINLVDAAAKIPLLAVYFEFNHLKQLYRQGWLQHGIDRAQCESVAEHVLGVALLAWMISDQYFPSLSQEKVIKIAMVHDLGEVYVGDLTPQDKVSPDDKHQQERTAVSKILGRLANGEVYLSLWEEYESGVSSEARLVRQVDRLEMALQALVYEGQGHVDLQDFFASASAAMTSLKLSELLEAAQTLRQRS